MHNKFYFTETKPGIFEKNSKFRIKTNWVTNTQYKEVEALGWRIRDRINNAIESMEKTKMCKTCQTKKKQPYEISFVQKTPK